MGIINEDKPKQNGIQLANRNMNACTKCVENGNATDCSVSCTQCSGKVEATSFKCNVDVSTPYTIRSNNYTFTDESNKKNVENLSFITCTTSDNKDCSGDIYIYKRKQYQ